MQPLFTEEEGTLVMTILIDNLITLKDNNGLDDYGTTEALQSAINKLDAFIIQYGYEDEQ
jgi:hypothetical protein